MRSAFAPLLLIPLCFSVPGAAQESAAESASYRVEITLHETGARGPEATRQYVMVTSPGASASVRLGQRIPYARSVSAPSQAEPQYFYADRGVSVECRVSAANVPSRVNLVLRLDFSDPVFGEKRPELGGPGPSNDTVQLLFPAVVPLGTKSLIGSVDDPVLERRLAVEALVTRQP